MANNKLQYLFLIIVSLFSATCQKEYDSPEALESLVDKAGKLFEYIDLGPNVENQEGILGSTTCSITTYRLDKKLDILLNFSSNIIEDLYPGSVIQGRYINSGTVRSIGDFDRRPLTISLFSNGIATKSTTVDTDFSFDAFDIKISEMLAGSSAIDISDKRLFASTFAYSKEQALLELGIGKDWLSDATVDFSVSKDANCVFMYFKQPYYSVGINPPNNFMDFYSQSITQRDISFTANDENPIGYIKEIVYGRHIVAKFQSSIYSREEINAAVKAKFENLNSEASEILNNCEISAYAIGGKPPEFTNVNDIYNYIKDGMNFSSTDNASPISYTANYCKDHSEMTSGGSVLYVEKAGDCVFLDLSDQYLTADIVYYKTAINTEDGVSYEVPETVSFVANQFSYTIDSTTNVANSVQVGIKGKMYIQDEYIGQIAFYFNKGDDVNSIENYEIKCDNDKAEYAFIFSKQIPNYLLTDASFEVLAYTFIDTLATNLNFVKDKLYLSYDSLKKHVVRDTSVLDINWYNYAMSLAYSNNNNDTVYHIAEYSSEWITQLVKSNINGEIDVFDENKITSILIADIEKHIESNVGYISLDALQNALASDLVDVRWYKDIVDEFYTKQNFNHSIPSNYISGVNDAIFERMDEISNVVLGRVIDVLDERYIIEEDYIGALQTAFGKRQEDLDLFNEYLDIILLASKVISDDGFDTHCTTNNAGKLNIVKMEEDFEKFRGLFECEAYNFIIPDPDPEKGDKSETHKISIKNGKFLILKNYIE